MTTAIELVFGGLIGILCGVVSWLCFERDHLLSRITDLEGKLL